MEQRLLLAQMAIEGVLADRDLQTALARRGYDQARMMEGKALRDQAEALFQQQSARAGDQQGATKARNEAQAEAHIFYMGLVALARVALREEPGMAKALDVITRRKYTTAGWLAQAKKFYVNALNDAAILARLAAYGITSEELEQGRSQVEAVAAGQVAREQRKGAKQENTRMCDAAFKALDCWMRDFKVVARVALVRQPQTLEELGVVVRSSEAT